jgi:hypothetical protein
MMDFDEELLNDVQLEAFRAKFAVVFGEVRLSFRPRQGRRGVWGGEIII